MKPSKSDFFSFTKSLISHFKPRDSRLERKKKESVTQSRWSRPEVYWSGQGYFSMNRFVAAMLVACLSVNTGTRKGFYFLIIQDPWVCY